MKNRTHGLRRSSASLLIDVQVSHETKRIVTEGAYKDTFVAKTAHNFRCRHARSADIGKGYIRLYRL